jgi:hypothetical protein
MAQAKIHWLITDVGRERRYGAAVDVLKVTFRAAHKVGPVYESISGTEFTAVLQANYGGTDPISSTSHEPSDWYGLRFSEVNANRYVARALTKLVEARADGFGQIVSTLRAVYATHITGEHYWQYERAEFPVEVDPPVRQRILSFRTGCT